MSRLLILTSGELTRDPRARRAVSAALDAGFSVDGVCSTAGGSPIPLSGVVVTRVPGDGVSARLRAAGFGGGRTDRPLLREARGLFRLVRLTRLTRALSHAARDGADAAIVHANDFDTLPAGWLIARRNAARLVYDAHEIYTEQEADPPRLQRWIVARVERMLARRAAAVVTVNEPIAEELTRRLRLRAPAFVVRNAPAVVPLRTAVAVEGPLRVIYQGALGHGRALEDIVTAADLAGDAVRVSLRVVGVPLDDVRRYVGARADVLEPVEPDVLVEALAQFDVGVVVTRPLTLNDELATPNKLFEYLMAGLAVAVPRLPGVAPLVETERIGVTFEPGDPTDLARVLRELARDRDRLAAYRDRARRLAVERYNAEAERAALAAAWGLA